MAPLRSFPPPSADSGVRALSGPRRASPAPQVCAGLADGPPLYLQATCSPASLLFAASCTQLPLGSASCGTAGVRTISGRAAHGNSPSLMTRWLRPHPWQHFLLDRDFRVTAAALVPCKHPTLSPHPRCLLKPRGRHGPTRAKSFFCPSRFRFQWMPLVTATLHAACFYWTFTTPLSFSRLASLPGRSPAVPAPLPMPSAQSLTAVTVLGTHPHARLRAPGRSRGRG